MTARPGDWIRFQAIGELRIGVVQYVRDMERYPYKREAVTDVGTVDLAAILEVRAAPVLVLDDAETEGTR